MAVDIPCNPLGFATAEVFSIDRHRQIVTISNDEAEQNAKGRILMIGRWSKGVFESFRSDTYLCVVRSVRNQLFNQLLIYFFDQSRASTMAWPGLSVTVRSGTLHLRVASVGFWTCGVKIPLWVQSHPSTPRLKAQQPSGSAGSPYRFQRTPSDRPPIPPF